MSTKKSTKAWTLKGKRRMASTTCLILLASAVRTSRALLGNQHHVHPIATDWLPTTFLHLSDGPAGESGPRGEARRKNRRRSRVGGDGRRGPNSSTIDRDTAVNPPKTSPPAPFIPSKLVRVQKSNDYGYEPMDLVKSSLRPMYTTEDEEGTVGEEIGEDAHFRYLSLDELCCVPPGREHDNGRGPISNLFWTNAQFREELRMSIRQDIFDTTAAYQSISEKGKEMLLQPDSSLEGSWRCPCTDDDERRHRMTRTTHVLRKFLGDDGGNGTSFTGDELLNAIGKLCGTEATNHWIDIVGIKNRLVRHSWHQDTGIDGDRFTVLWGFPSEDGYTGTGVFTHVAPLARQHFAPAAHPRNEPVLFQGEVEERHVVRPEFGLGRELLVYRDVDLLHSAPDVTFRKSVMRFM